MPASPRRGDRRISFAFGAIALALCATAHGQTTSAEARCEAAQLAAELTAGRIPDVTGCPFEDVQPVFKRFDHPPQRESESSDLASGTISRQDPQAGSERRSSTKVTLWVSDGKGAPAAASAAAADLSVTVTIDPSGPYEVGQSVTYWIVVRNIGPSVATQVRLDGRRENLTLASTSPGCSELPCDIVDLNPESSARVFVTATIDQPGRFAFEATAEAAEPDPDEQNNRTRLDGETVAPAVATPPASEPAPTPAPAALPIAPEIAPALAPKRPVGTNRIDGVELAVLILVALVLASLVVRHWYRRRKLERVRRRISVRIGELATIGRPSAQTNGKPPRCLALQVHIRSAAARVLGPPPLKDTA